MNKIRDKYKVRLLNLVELDPGAKMLMVEITETVPVWYGTKLIKYETDFVYVDSIWLGHNNATIVDTELSYRLQEILVAQEAEKRIDRYITLSGIRAG